jgi:P27 family predicted phage terminase small subunit
MTKGRKKISDASKRLRGTDQPCRMDGELVPMAPATTLPKPKGLKGTAKKLYQMVGTELANKGLIDAVNIDLLLAYCREMALYKDMMKELETEGYTVKVATKNSSITQINPKRKIAENALIAAKTLAAEFGISPASRARVAAMIAGIQKKDDFADFETVDEQ